MAEESVRDLVDLDNSAIPSIQVLARYLKERQGSVHDMDMASALDPNFRLSFNEDWIIARLKQRVGYSVRALDDPNMACELTPDYVTCLIARAAVKHSMNDTQGSLHDLDTAHDLEPQNTFILKERVALKVMTKDYPGALVDLDKAHHLDPDDFTRRMRKAFRQNSQQYLDAMANLLAEVFRNATEDMFLRSFWRDIIESFEDLSSQMSFLLELTKIVLQIWTCHSMIVTFTFKYLMGYVERGQWGTYSNGSWEFRATYVCIELRLGAYPFQKFRDVAPTSHHDRTQITQPTRHLSIATSQSLQQQSGAPFLQRVPPGERTKYCGVYRRLRKGKQGPRMVYEPRESSKRDNLKRVYLGEHRTLEDAVLIRDVAHFCLGKQGPFNVDPVLYKSLAPIPQGHTQQQIHKLVLERVKEVDRLAFKYKLDTAKTGLSPTLHYLHSNEQASQDDDSHLGDDHIDSGEESIISEPLPVPQDGVSSQHEVTTFAELMSNNLSAPNESPDLYATTERIVVTHPTCTHSQMINDLEGVLFYEVDFSSGEAIISETLPVPQDGVSPQHEVTTFAELSMSNNLSVPNESPDLHATTEPIVVTYPTCTESQMINDLILVHSHESTRACNDRPQDMGFAGNTLCSTNLPFCGPSPSSNELWTRQIVIKAPVGTTLVQQNGTQELVYSSTLVLALSALDVFGVENWTMVPPCAFPDHPDMSNGREGSRESWQYVFRLQKSGSPEELAISDSIRAALDNFRDLTGWIPWY